MPSLIYALFIYATSLGKLKINYLLLILHQLQKKESCVCDTLQTANQ